MSYLKECDVFVQNLQMHMINMKREKKIRITIAVFILCQLNVFLSRLVFGQDVEFYSIGSDHCLVIYFAQIGTFSRTQVHKIE